MMEFQQASGPVASKTRGSLAERKGKSHNDLP